MHVEIDKLGATSQKIESDRVRIVLNDGRVITVDGEALVIASSIGRNGNIDVVIRL
jgi:hypothetical protein